MSRRAYVVGLALGLALFALAGGARIPPVAAHGDFAEQWAAARVVLEGGDPYQTATWRADAARLAGRASDSAAFVYPPYVAFALIPLGLLPVDVAATLWIALSIAVAALGVSALLRSFPPPHPLVSLGVGFAVLASGGSLLALAQGQSDLLLLGVLSWSISMLVAERRTSGAAAFLLAKPQLAPVALLALARSATPIALRRYVVGLAVAFALIAATLVRLDWWREWASASLRFQADPPIRAATIATLFEPLGVWSVAAIALTLAVVVVLSVRADAAASLSRWLAAGVLIAPYTQAYDHVLLIAPLVTATSRGAGRARAALAAAGIIVLVAGDLVLAWLTARAGHDVGAAIVPLAIWVIVVLATRRGYSPTNF